MQFSAMTMKRVLVAALVGVLLALPVKAFADDDVFDQDHDLARDLYERGQIHALIEILRIVQAHTPGEVIGVQLNRQGDRWIYQVQVVDPEGRRTTVDVDAGDAAVIDDGAHD